MKFLIIKNKTYKKENLFLFNHNENFLGKENVISFKSIDIKGEIISEFLKAESFIITVPLFFLFIVLWHWIYHYISILIIMNQVPLRWVKWQKVKCRISQVPGIFLLHLYDRGVILLY